MDLGLVNAFLSATAANDTEKLVQLNVQNLNETYNKVLKQRNDLALALKRAEEELLKVSGALENQLSMAEFLAKQKGLEPLPLQQEEKVETQTVTSEKSE